MRRMNTRLGCLLFLSVVSPAFLSLAQQAAQTQPGDFTIRNIQQQLINGPVMVEAAGQGISGSAYQKKWLRIETQYDSKPAWADDLTFKYYVLLRRGRDAKLFTGEVTYVNVARGSGHISGVFVHPNMVDRYGQGRVEAVAVEVRHQGRLMDSASDQQGGPHWWEQFTPVPGYLLTPQQTPWSINAYLRYEQIKPLAARID